MGRPVKSATAEPGITNPGNAAKCPARSPSGAWYCCLPPGHHMNHIGTTGDYELLYQWPQTVPAAEYENYATATRSIVARSAARSRDAIEQIPCPRCGAKPGKHCYTPSGWEANSHLERRAAAQSAGLWNPPCG
jgi:hypothetical protein